MSGLADYDRERNNFLRDLAELKERDATFVARAGDSIDLFEIPAPR